MNTHAIVIRRMMAADLEGVVELDRLSFSDPWSLATWQDMLDDPNAQVWVMEMTTAALDAPVKLVGALATWQVLDELHIGTLAVHPEYRQQGLGARLLETGLREGIARSATQAHLEVRRSNIPAQRLYQRFGFEMVGERKRYYADNREDAVLMSVYGLGEGYMEWLNNRWKGASVW